MMPDTPASRLCFSSLRFRDQFALWSTRMWITASSREPHMPARVREAFAVAGIGDAAESLHALLSILATNAHRTLHFRPVGCPRVSAEEARFLTLLTAARERAAEDRALQLLAEWLPPAAARLALEAARPLAHRLLVAARPGDPEDTSDFRVGPTLSSPDPGIALLH